MQNKLYQYWKKLLDLTRKPSSDQKKAIKHHITISLRFIPSHEELEINIPFDTTPVSLLENLLRNQQALPQLHGGNFYDYLLVNKNSGNPLNMHLELDRQKVREGTVLICTPFLLVKKRTEIPSAIELYNIPPEIRGIDKIKDFVKQVDTKESVPLNECKVIFIGAGGVGKTSLIQRMTTGVYDPQQGMTDGININSWHVDLDGEKIKLNIWDFGGQEIMHTIHKLFLTQRTIYVLVVNPRIEDKHCEAELLYWLKLVTSYSKDSPILIAINKCEIHTMDLGKGELQDKFPQIEEFIETSCADNIGIDELKTAIGLCLRFLPHVQSIFPQSYLQIKSRLEQINKDYLNYNEYLAHCREITPMLDEKDLEDLVRLLNDLGVFLNIRQNRRLLDTHVLNPEWVTKGVYRIITSKELILRKGILTYKSIEEILQSEEFPTSKEVGFILDMLTHFELCYHMPDFPDTYFIPNSFPKDKPKALAWDHSASLNFQYRYDVLPGSVMSRFIVKIHAMIKDDLFWRNGVILEENGVAALIQAFPYDKKIEISIAGKGDKKDLLRDIRREFKKVHNTLPKVEVKSYIVIDHTRGIVVDFEHLKVYEEAGEEYIFIPELRKKYLVKALLGGVEATLDYDKLRSQVAQNNIEEVLNTLYQNYPENTTLITLKASFAQINQDKMNGIQSHEAFLLAMRKIRLELIVFLDTYGRN